MIESNLYEVDPHDGSLRTVQFVVPGPPVAWKRARRSPRGSYTDGAVKSWQDVVAWTCRAAMPAGTPVAFHGRVAVRCEFTLPERGHDPDVDNLAKAVLDAMNGVAYDDDRQVAVLHASKSRGDDPRAVIAVSHVHG